MDGFKGKELEDIMEVINNIPGYQCSMNQKKCEIFVYKDIRTTKNDVYGSSKLHYQYEDFLQKFDIEL